MARLIVQMHTNNMTEKFQPKTEEAIKLEVLEDLGEEYEGNEEKIDKVVARRLKDEEFKTSVHKDKMDTREKLKETRKLAGLDPETGEKIESNDSKETKETKPNGESLTAKDAIALRDIHEEDLDYLLGEAKLRGKSISELKKDPYMKIILQTRAEERKTAEATATVPTHKSKSNGEDLLKKADEYKLTPEEMKEAAKEAITSAFK